MHPIVADYHARSIIEERHRQADEYRRGAIARQRRPRRRWVAVILAARRRHEPNLPIAEPSKEPQAAGRPVASCC